MDASASLTLNRLLSRLEQSLLSGGDQSHLRYSQYERQKAATNIEYARTLLLTLEKQTSTLKSQTQKQQTQADLQRKRELVKRLNSRIQELNQLGDASDSDGDSDDDDAESVDGNGNGRIPPSYAPAQTNTQDGLDATSSPSPQISPPFAQQQQQSQSDLRARRPLQSSDNRSAASTTAREALFANRTTQPSTGSSLSQKETLLSHNRTEQESLTTGLLGLAHALKESSQQFSKSLADEKDVMKRAEGGLDKNAQGMEAAERRMGMLRRMSEGQGWWGRIKLYGFIFALWVGCFLVVFVGPKLRL